MLISCPNCATNFSVPDQALGTKGRMLKCAKCGHKWHQAAPRPEDDFGLDDFPEPVPQAARVMPPPPRMTDDFRPVNSPSDLDMDSHDDGLDGGYAPSLDDDINLDEVPIPDLGPRVGPDDRPADLDLDADQPQPIPAVFADKSRQKGGTGFLWFLVFLLILGGLGGGAYYFQDKVVEAWPPAGQILAQVGLLHEKPGAGLELRNAGTPERFVHNDTEVLVVRGIIANVSERDRPVPGMKLVLLDKDKNVVQEKMAQPPVTSLEAGGTAGFRIILERPDPNAVEVNVMFVDGAEAQ